MIIDSDNVAKDLLLDYADRDTLYQLFGDLDIELPDAKTPDDKYYGISVKTYSLFFRTLYNSTILNRNDSEKALQLLSKTTFKTGIIAGIPENIAVAHKFGAHVSPPIGNELHDCGIIYYPQKPYLLCVMTRGRDANKLALVITNISKSVFEFIKNN